MKVLELPFEERLTPFSTPSSYDSFRTFSPSGTVPCLIDGGTAIWDSLAITEYLHERHEGVWPADQAGRDWARCAAAEIHAGFSTLRSICGMNCGIRVRLWDISLALQKDLDRLTELWNDGLSRFGGPFLAGGQFTAADAFFCPVAFRVQTYGLELGSNSAAYVERILGLVPMREWYGAALAEKWREASHEEEVRAAGELTADLRASPS